MNMMNEAHTLLIHRHRQRMLVGNVRLVLILKILSFLFPYKNWYRLTACAMHSTCSGPVKFPASASPRIFASVKATGCTREYS